MRLLVTCSTGQCLENKDIHHALTAPGVPLPRAFSAERTRNVACTCMCTEISDSNIMSQIIPSLLFFYVCKSPQQQQQKSGHWFPYSITCLPPLYPYLYLASTRWGEGIIKALPPAGDLWWKLPVVLGHFPWHPNIRPFNILI